MSVVGENRSQLPFPQLERNKQGINLRPSSVEVLIDYLDDSTSYSFDKRTRLPVPLPFENDFASLTDEVTCPEKTQRRRLTKTPARKTWPAMNRPFPSRTVGIVFG